MNIEIRPATVDDLDAIRRCVAAAYAAYVPVLGVEPAAMHTDFRPLVEAGKVHVLALDREVIAMVTLKPGDDHLEVSTLAVLPDCQGRGWGRRMVEFAEERTLALGLPEIRLYTNEKLEALVAYYGKLGFEVTERRLDQGYRRVFMRKRLLGLGAR